MLKAKIVEKYKIGNSPWQYTTEEEPDGCLSCAEMLPEDKKSLGEPEIGETVYIAKVKKRKLIVGRNGVWGPSGCL